jgi:5-methylcytosine-specific restriction endonuclease McrA
VYDHIVPDALGGEPVLDNCAAIRKACHDVRTFQKGGDITKIAKAKRGERGRLGLEGKKSTLPGGRGSRLKMKVDGTVVLRDAE